MRCFFNFFDLSIIVINRLKMNKEEYDKITSQYTQQINHEENEITRLRKLLQVHIDKKKLLKQNYQHIYTKYIDENNPLYADLWSTIFVILDDN